MINHSRLFNGTKVILGSDVEFLDSDGVLRKDKIRERFFQFKHRRGRFFRYGSLYFYNIDFSIKNYKNAKLCTHTTQ